ncbi:hypothetical protein Pan44_23170 [Caulifigura coniformis]|uniref:Uncharacterized protein n=1 Tax=Caulifigura coniformis TaxID=2527983 RepID=A0A517SDU0_9PLAN|nr:hypothetical protein [Caulifigura coniformis]QDT54289.1 hypothetical protein Pan44_23170 [Caulifigura coniformis]
MWKPKPGTRRRKANVKRAVEAILPLDIDVKLKRRLLDACIWRRTELSGKHALRYVSVAARDLPPGCIHEHVFTRKRLIDDLMAGKPVGAVLKRAIACVVTGEEHTRLKDGNGWKRYREAGIKVYDRKTGKVR